MPSPADLHTFTLRPVANTRRSTAQVAATYTPKSLMPAQWALAREAVVDVVISSGTTNSQAVDRLGALCAFLATCPAWDRTSAPLLRVLLTQRNVQAWMLQQGTQTSRRQGVSQLLPLARRVSGAAPHLRLPRELDLQLGALPQSPVAFVALTAALTANVGHRVDGPVWRLGTAAPDRTSTFLAADVISTLAECTLQELSMPAPPSTTPATGPSTSSRTNAPTSSKPLSRAARKRAAKEARVRHAALARAGITRPVEEFGNAPEVLEAIERYRPVTDILWDEVRPLTCYLAAAYRPVHPERAKSVTSSLAGFVCWYATSAYRQDRSTPLTLVELQRIDVADAYIATRSDLSENSRGTTRSIIRRALRQGDNAPKADVLQKRPVTGPYTPAQCRTLLEVAAAQPTRDRTRQTLWLVSLGLGAGLSAGDFLHLRRSDLSTVTIDGTPVLVVAIPGTKPRAVPVMAGHEHAVRAAMAMHDEDLQPEDYVINGAEGRKQVLRTTLRRLVTTTGELPINQARLRATWLFAAIHAPVPLTVLLDVAGLDSARSLTELAAYSTARDIVTDTTLALVAQQVQR